MFVDYETLRVIWWLLIGVLLAGFAIMDGFDLGVAMWLPWLTKSDMERRVLINSIAPTWEGNQVWFVLGGGAIFAAWPDLYALSFSGFYLAMLLILLALILRPVGFKYRSKIDNATWRSIWDWALFTGGFVPALIFGVAVGNVLQGVPFHFDSDLRTYYTGAFWQLLNPFALGCGVLSVMMLAMHGAFFLQIKTAGTLQERARKAAFCTAILTIGLFIALGIWTYYGIAGYALQTNVVHDGPSNPLFKAAVLQSGAWFSNYAAYPLTMLVPTLAIAGILLALLFIRRSFTAFVFSALGVGCVIATVGVSMFPFILPSSEAPAHSLLVWDSSSSQMTLFVMLLVTLIFMPIIVAYTSWVYRVLRGKVTEKTIEEQRDSAY